MEGEFIEKEEKRAVWDLGQNKALGLDGFLFFFFRTFWSSIKQDLCDLFKEVHNGIARLDRLNYSNIVLIPKKSSPSLISDYRLIALLNSVLKIVSNVLASRLTPQLQKMIAEIQTGFIARRNILDDVATRKRSFTNAEKPTSRTIY